MTAQPPPRAARRSPSRTRLATWSGAIALGLVLGCREGPSALFADAAAPVIERRCASSLCHGVSVSGALPSEGFFLHVDATGRLADLEEARRAALARVTTTADARLSSLLRVPLAVAEGGGPHQGGELFVSSDEEGARALILWIDSERDGTGGEDVELTPLEQRFAADVMPVLVARCGIAGCHGPDDVANTAFPAVRDPRSGAFAPRDVPRMRRVVRKLVDLWGSDVRRSRLFRKPLGAARGLRHRGGPGTFFPEAPPDDPLGAPALAGILSWAEAERRAAGVTDVAPRAILVVRDVPSERAPYRIEPGAVGSELLLVPWPVGSGEIESLTDLLRALLGVSSLEIREPAVAHDGHTVAVSVRAEGSGRFGLVELDLDTRRARRITPEDAAGSFVSPVYGPDARLVAAWDGHGESGRDGAGVPPELVAFEGDGTMERLTWTLAPEVRPGVLATGKTRGMIVFGTRREGPAGHEGVLFRFPTCHDPALHGEPEYHVQFGASLAPRAAYVARDLPDGRQIVTVLSSVEVDDDRGALEVLDRSLGPFAAGGAVSIPLPVPALVTLDATERWRDPVVLPDGRVLASTDDAGPDGQDALVLITVVDGVDGPSIAERETLLADAGVAYRSAAVVIPRPVEEDEHVAVVDPSSPVARIALRDATVLEALYGRVEPLGARILRDDIAAVRALVPVDASGSVGRGARVLGEASLAADHSAELQIPARTPVLLQLLDARGMMVGRQLDRWFYGEGDEVVPAGTNPASYGVACAGCHGALSGDPEDVAARPPDVLSSASVTLSTHRDRNRRLPIPPTDLATATPADVSFAAVVAPILVERCASCHDGPEPAASLSLDPTPPRAREVYDALLAHVEGPRARRSPLIERVLGEELEAAGSPTRRCPPEGLSELEVRRLVQWIEAGGSFEELGHGS